MSEALSWLVTVSLWTAGVFAAVRIVDLLLSRAVGPRGRMALYALVLVRLALPPDFSSPVGVVGERSVADAAPEAAPAVAIPWLSRSQPAAAPVAAVTTPVAAPGVAAPYVVYLGGVALLLGLALVRRRAFARLVAEATPAPAELAALGAPARVVLHPDRGPVAAGLFDRVIMLPAPLVDRFAPPELACVIAHERAHHEGRDTWLALALRVVTAVAWPVIPVWLAARRVRTLMEIAADERALGHHRRLDYGRVLLDLADTAPRRPQPALGAYRDLRARIVAIAHPTRTPRAVQLALVTGVAAVILACAAVPEDGSDEPRAAECDVLKSRATRMHDDVETSRNLADYPAVEDAYADYLEACEADPDHALIAYYAGEAHWAHAVELHNGGDTEAAAPQFSAARALFDRAIDEGTEMTPDAAYGQHVATLNAHAWKPGEGNPRRSDDLRLVAYSETEADVLASWERYVDVVGRPVEHATDNQLAMARLMMGHNDFARARPELAELATSAAGKPAGLAAAEMLVDVLAVTWTTAADESRAAARRDLMAWLDRLEASTTWSMPDAAPLREAAEQLRAASP